MHAIDNESYIRESMGLDVDTYGKLMDAARAAVATAHTTDGFDTEVNHRPAAQQWAVCTP